jgi:hypothetical protein
VSASWGRTSTAHHTPGWPLAAEGSPPSCCGCPAYSFLCLSAIKPTSSMTCLTPCSPSASRKSPFTRIRCRNGPVLVAESFRAASEEEGCSGCPAPWSRHEHAQTSLMLVAPSRVHSTTKGNSRDRICGRNGTMETRHACPCSKTTEGQRRKMGKRHVRIG